MKNIILFPLILILIVYFAISFVVPAYKDASALREEVQQQQAENDKLTADLDAVRTFATQMQSHSAEKTFVEGFVPSDPQEQMVINSISRIAQAHNVNLFTIGFAEQFNNRGYRTDDEDATVQYVQGSFVASGAYDDLRGFARDIFNIDRLYIFDDMTLEKSEVSGDAEETAPQPQILNLTTSFRYAYTSTTPQMGADVLNNINYDDLARIERAAKTVPSIEAVPQERTNPFAP